MELVLHTMKTKTKFSSAQGPWAQAKLTPIFCDAATTLEVGKILSDSSHVTLLDHR